MGEAVVKRQDDEHHSPLLHVDDRRALLHVGRIVTVCEKDALGIGGGAGSVAYVGIVVGTYGSDAPLEFPGIVFHELETHFTQLANVHFAFLKGNIVQHYDFAHARAGADDAADLVKFHLGSHHVNAVGVVDAEIEVVVGFKLV